MTNKINNNSPTVEYKNPNDANNTEREIQELLYELRNNPNDINLLKEIYNKLLALRDAGYNVSTLLIHTRKEIEQGYASKDYIEEMINTLLNNLHPVTPADSSKKQPDVDSLFAVLFLLSKASMTQDALRRFIESITASSNASDPDQNAYKVQTILPNKA